MKGKRCKEALYKGSRPELSRSPTLTWKLFLEAQENVFEIWSKKCCGSQLYKNLRGLPSSNVANTLTGTQKNPSMAMKMCLTEKLWLLADTFGDTLGSPGAAHRSRRSRRACTEWSWCTCPFPGRWRIAFAHVHAPTKKLNSFWLIGTKTVILRVAAGTVIKHSFNSEIKIILIRKHTNQGTLKPSAINRLLSLVSCDKKEAITA